MDFFFNLAICLLALVGLVTVLSWLGRLLRFSRGKPSTPSILLLLRDKESLAEGILRQIGGYGKAKGLDVVVIDDGSQDSTGEIAVRVAREYSMRCFHSKNPDVSVMEFGFAMCRFPVVLVVDLRGRAQADCMEDLILFLEGGVEGKDCEEICGISRGVTRCLPALMPRRGGRDVNS